jgi:acyl dehydratase
VNVGDSARRSRVVQTRDIELFTEITGDRNPLHYDEEAAGRCRVRRANVNCGWDGGEGPAAPVFLEASCPSGV